MFGKSWEKRGGVACALMKRWTEELRSQEGFCAGAPRPKGELQSRSDF